VLYAVQIRIKVLILLRKINHCRVFRHLQLVVFVPRLAPLLHQLVHILHLSSTLHPLLHHFLVLLQRYLLVAFKNVPELRFLGVDDFFFFGLFICLFFGFTHHVLLDSLGFDLAKLFELFWDFN